MSQPVISPAVASNGVTADGTAGTGVAAETANGVVDSTGTTSGGDDHAKAYTQSQIDSMIEDRIRRERAKFGDYADLKKKAAQFDQAAEAAKTDQEKAVEAARKEGAAEAAKVWKHALVQAEVRAQAANLQFHDPADAVVQLQTALADVAVTDDGTVDQESIKKALDDLAARKTYLVGRRGTGAGEVGQGPRNGVGPANMNELIRGLGKR
jgi:hypothetical protein